MLITIIIRQTRTKAHNCTEKLDCEKHLPATKLSLIHCPSRESQTVRIVKGKPVSIASVCFDQALSFGFSVIALKTFYPILSLNVLVIYGVRFTFLIDSFLGGMFNSCVIWFLSSSDFSGSLKSRYLPFELWLYRWNKHGGRDEAEKR